MVSWSPMPSLTRHLPYSSRSSQPSQSNSRDNDFCFHRIFKGDTPDIARARHQHNIFSRLKLRTRPGVQLRVLEIGCGSGSASLELAKYANVLVLGVDDNARHVSSIPGQDVNKTSTHAHIDRGSKSVERTERSLKSGRLPSE